MTLQEATAWIEKSNGRLFSVKFVKRSTGEAREMLCRTGVTSHLNPEPTKKQPYQPKAAGVITVFDMKSKGYRSIPLEGLKEIKIDGEWLVVQ